MKKFAPSISIIVPAHNESTAIKKTLDSILNNRITLPYEVIVACNGCNDDTADIAREYGVRVIESEESGMSFGKNLGASAAENDFYIFIDADTTLIPGSIDKYIKAINKKCKTPEGVIGTVAGYPEKGGIVVKTCFMIANTVTSMQHLHAPGGVMLMSRNTFDHIGGFNESIKQGTSTDLILRAVETGAEYLYISRPKATTSIRRFEKKGIIHQMLDWRKNHRHMKCGDHKKLEDKDYKVIR